MDKARNAAAISMENAVNIMTMPSCARLFVRLITSSCAESAVKTNTMTELMVNNNAIRIINLGGLAIKNA